MIDPEAFCEVIDRDNTSLLLKLVSIHHFNR